MLNKALTNLICDPLQLIKLLSLIAAALMTFQPGLTLSCGSQKELNGVCRTPVMGVDTVWGKKKLLRVKRGRLPLFLKSSHQCRLIPIKTVRLLERKQNS